MIPVQGREKTTHNRQNSQSQLPTAWGGWHSRYFKYSSYREKQLDHFSSAVQDLMIYGCWFFAFFLSCDFVNQCLQWWFCLCLSHHSNRKTSAEPLISLFERQSTTAIKQIIARFKQNQRLFRLFLSICKHLAFGRPPHQPYLMWLCRSCHLAAQQLMNQRWPQRKRLWIHCIDAGFAVQWDFNTQAIEGSNI